MSDWYITRKRAYSENWPVDENGTPEEPVFLQHVSGGPLDMEMTINLLEAYGMPVLTQYPNNGEFANVIIGFAATGIDIFVPVSRKQEAINLLSATIIEEENEENVD